MSLMRGTLFRGALFAGLLFAGQNISIGEFEPWPGDSKHIVHAHRDIHSVWVRYYRIMRIASDFVPFSPKAKSSLVWHSDFRFVEIQRSARTSVIVAKDRTIVVDRDEKKVVAVNAMSADNEPKATLYIEAQPRSIVIGNRDRVLVVEKSSRIVMVQPDIAVTT